jgi:hypothetical protein
MIFMAVQNDRKGPQGPTGHQNVLVHRNLVHRNLVLEHQDLVHQDRVAEGHLLHNEKNSHKRNLTSGSQQANREQLTESIL